MSKLNTRVLDVGDSEILHRCLSGEVILLPRLLQKSGLFTTVSETLLRTIGAIAGSRAANELRPAGFGELHRLIDGDQLQKVIVHAEKKLSLMAPRLLFRILKRGFAYQKPLWVLRKPLLRCLPPHDWTYEYRCDVEAFRTYYGDGRMTTLRPHRDSWYTEPPDCINVWIALGTVIKGNGLSIYKDVYGVPLAYEPHKGVVREQPLCQPDNFSMSRGDALIFHAEQLHASELNHTHYTRSVLSLRFALENPRRRTRQPQRYSKVNPAYPASFLTLHPLYGFASRRIAALIGGTSDREETRDRNRVLSGELQRENRAERDEAKDSLPLAMLETGVPMAVSSKRCVIRLETDEVYSLDRWCPHQGADLALGYTVGRRLFCPWHNLPFDIESGLSPCASVRCLNAKPCAVEDGHIRIGTT